MIAGRFFTTVAVRPEVAVVSAFRRTREVRLKPDTTYYRYTKTAVARTGGREEPPAAG